MKNRSLSAKNTFRINVIRNSKEIQLARRNLTRRFKSTSHWPSTLFGISGYCIVVLNKHVLSIQHSTCKSLSSFGVKYEKVLSTLLRASLIQVQINGLHGCMHNRDTDQYDYQYRYYTVVRTLCSQNEKARLSQKKL